MSFPDTRLTLVQRLASQGSEEDWRLFLKDYWGPICRFSMCDGVLAIWTTPRKSPRKTFEVIWQKPPAGAMGRSSAAKLRTLLCGVVRNILAQSFIAFGQAETVWLRDLGRSYREVESFAQRHEQVDSFLHAAWVEQRCLDSTGRRIAGQRKYYCRNQGDYMRVFPMAGSASN